MVIFYGPIIRSVLILLQENLNSELMLSIFFLSYLNIFHNGQKEPKTLCLVLRKVSMRKSGATAGGWDTYITGPAETNFKRFRSKQEIRRYFEQVNTGLSLVHTNNMIQIPSSDWLNCLQYPKMASDWLMHVCTFHRLVRQGCSGKILTLTLLAPKASMSCFRG